MKKNQKHPEGKPNPSKLNNNGVRDSDGPETLVGATGVVPLDEIGPPGVGRPGPVVLRRGRSLQPPQIPPAPAGVHRHPGGVRQGRAEEPQARAPPRPGGGQEDPVGAACHRPVHGDGRPEQWDRRLHHRLQLLRQDSQHHQPRAPQALRLRRPPPPLERACRRSPARGRFQYLASQPVREARCHL